LVSPPRLSPFPSWERLGFCVFLHTSANHRITRS
jgi:hypothetical protein